jgi:hypothetical protein
MSSIIAGRFPTFPAAEAAAGALFQRGFAHDDVSVFYVNPPGQHAKYPIGGDRDVDPGARKTGKGASGGLVIGAVVGAMLGIGVVSVVGMSLLVMMLAAGVGAYLGSLIGALALTRGGKGEAAVNEATGEKAVRDAGVLLAVHVTEANRPTAVSVFKQAGAEDVETANGTWRNGDWADFDPLEPPVPVEQGRG